IPALRKRLPKPGPWMDRFRKWMALPMGLTALALGWLLTQQVEGLLWSDIASALVVGIGFIALYRHWMSGPDRGHVGKLLLLVPAITVGALTYQVMAAKPSTVVGEPRGDVFSPNTLAKARATGKPVFVYFTADWCLSCKANEAGAINREAVQTAFEKAGVVTLVGDWTNGDPVITRTLGEHGRNSVPLYLWYAPGAEAPLILPQILTPGTLTELVDS